QANGPRRAAGLSNCHQSDIAASPPGATVRRFPIWRSEMKDIVKLLTLAAMAAPAAALSQDLAEPVFLGEIVLPTELSIAGMPFGGISGLDYDAENDLFYAISDDRAQNGPARFYVLKLAVADGQLAGLDIVSTHTLLDRE